MAEPKQLPGDGGLAITVVTPAGPVTHCKVESVTAFGSLGEFQVLPGHIPYMTMLDTGVLVLAEGANKTVYAHGPGYLQVTSTGAVEALCERAAEAGTIDAAAAKADFEAADVELKKLGNTTDAEWKDLALKRAWALARIEAGVRH